MKILDTSLNGAGGVSTKKTASSGNAKKARSDTAAPQAGGHGDRIEVSSVGGQLGVLRGQLDNIPDVRVDLVRELKAKVEAGEYHRDATDIADAMIKDALKHG